MKQLKSSLKYKFWNYAVSIIWMKIDINIQIDVWADAKQYTREIIPSVEPTDIIFNQLVQEISRTKV